MFNVVSTTGNYSFYAGNESSWVTYTVTPTYNLTGDAYTTAKAFYNEKLTDIVEMIPAEWSRIQKVLFVNDYLAANYQYDPNYGQVDNSLLVRDAYSFFKKGYGVCQGYTTAMLAIMDRLNIPCTWCESTSMNHIWNVVQLNDDNWYHVDVTWNDPGDSIGGVVHTYFLLSESRMRTVDNAKHFDIDDWVYGQSVDCGSAYDTYFWSNAVSPFLPLDDGWYFKSISGLCRWDCSSNAAVELVARPGEECPE